MTTKTLSGIYVSAYNLTSPITILSITASGYLGGGLLAAGAGTYTIVNNGEVLGATSGVNLAGSGILTNTGTIWSTSTTAGRGIVMADGGVVTNGSPGAAQALIAGYYGVEVDGASGTVANYGTLIGVGKYGVKLANGGMVTNGASGATKALIEGDGTGVVVQAAAGAVSNFGSVLTTGTAAVGVQLTAGGAVTNGSATDAVARIEAVITGVLIQAAAGSVTNFGSVLATGTAGIAVELTSGGVVNNGANGDTGALIEGSDGVAVFAKAGTVNNFGTLNGGTNFGGGIGGFGVCLGNGGVITNGSATDTVALIDDPYYAVLIEGAVGVVSNFGTIGDPTAAAGVALGQGGTVINGGTSATGALIEGRVGVSGGGSPVTVRNFGTIQGALIGTLDSGVSLGSGGSVINGPAGDVTAFIGGGVGVYASNATASVSNFGTINGVVKGVYLKAGGQVTNGSATNTAALIQGKYAVSFDFPGTLTNYGTIVGGQLGVGAVLVGGRISNGANIDKVALISGFYGVEVAAGTVINNGTISGNSAPGSFGLLLGKYGALAINGSATNATALITGNHGAKLFAGATLTNFGTVQGTSGVAVVLTDATSRLNAEAGSVFKGQIQAGVGLVDFVAGVSTTTGIVSSGTVTGAGTMALSGGPSVFSPGLKLSVAGVKVSGAATTVTVGMTSLSYAGVWTQTGGTLSVAAGDRINFSGVGDSFAGTLSGAGTVAFVGGSDTLTGTTLTAAGVIINSAKVTLSGAITIGKAVTASSANLIIAAGGATFTGGGGFNLSNLATNKITGATAGATLTNVNDKITGAGNLGGGQMTLVNQVGGLINGNSATNGLTIDTGANTITNAGKIDETGGGGVTIKSAIANTGALIVNAGTLTVNGAVTGAGVVRIGGGTAFFASTFAENVVFTSTTGVLELASSMIYTGSVSGFSKAGTTSLDLVDIAFVSGTTKATYSGTTSSGVLTVTDGTHTAHILFAGDYTASVFTPSSDGHGGTTVVDPPKAATVQRLVEAMAGFDARSSPAGGERTSTSIGAWPDRLPLLAAPASHHSGAIA